jgi:hypothetical protein
MRRYGVEILIVIFFLSIPCRVLAGDEAMPPSPDEQISSYQLSDGSLLGLYPARAAIIDVKGRVAQIFETPYRVYYIKAGMPACKEKIDKNAETETVTLPTEESSAWYVGCINRGDTVPVYEKLLPLDPHECLIKKLFIMDDAAYVLYGTEESSVSVLMRFSLNEGRVEQKENIVDACSVQGKLLLIEDAGDSLRLNFNGGTVPLMMRGALRISTVYRERMAVISGDDGNELVDIRLLKNLYQFSRESGLKVPDEYNLVFDALDVNPADKPLDAETMVFYKIFIDGSEEGRTETGLKHVVKSFKIMCEAGEYHVIQVERWELDKWKKQYYRANNVYQPGAVRIFVPENRIIRLSLEFDGQEFQFRQSVMKE